MANYLTRSATTDSSPQMWAGGYRNANPALTLIGKVISLT
jgi:hypothetical protein